MVKKISAIILALVLCLSVMVVPVSAAPTLSGSQTTGVAFEFLDENGDALTSVQAGQFVTVNIYALCANDNDRMAAACFQVWFNSNVYTYVEDSFTYVGPADYLDMTLSKAEVITSGTPFTNVSGKMTDEELAYGWDSAMQIVPAFLSAKSYYAKENQNTVFATFELQVNEGVEIGTVAALGAPAASTFVKRNATYNYVQTASVAKPANATAAEKILLDNGNGTSFEVKVPACETHTWDNGVEDPIATCGVAGVMTYTCTVCGATETAEVPATGNHTAGDPVDEVKTNPSCNATGLKDVVVSCTVCGDEISRTEETIPATGDHNYVNEVERVEPTCTEDGYYVLACGCGERDAATPIPATGHDYDSVVTEPTCTEDGYTTYTCTVCQDSYTGDEVEATGHNYEEVVTAPTCTAGGYTTYTCTVCQDSYIGDEVEATGHNYEEVVTAPTCTAGGYTTYTCTVCQDSYTGDEVEATGHNYEVTYVKQPSCSKEGLTEYTCSICDDKKEESIPSKNHTYEDGSSALVDIPAVAPTCKNHGYTAGSRCALCNANVVTPSRVEATGHTKADGVVTEPTYFESGYTTYTCPDCGETFKDDFVDKKTVDFTFNIAEPTTTVLRARDTIILHPEFEGEVAEGVTVTWTADNENFKIVEVYEDGSVKVSAKKAAKGTDGITTFTATVVDAEGNEITSDTVELTANAKFFQQFLGFFRAIFGLTKNYEK